MSLNIPVKLVGGAGMLPDSSSAAGPCSGLDPMEPNTAVKSPTFVLGGSIGCEEREGKSDGPSPRNGP